MVVFPALLSNLHRTANYASTTMFFLCACLCSVPQSSDEKLRVKKSHSSFGELVELLFLVRSFSGAFVSEGRVRSLNLLG